MKIQDVFVKEIFDSRGESTIEVGLNPSTSSGQKGLGDWQKAQIPSGKSRGKREAAVLPYGEAAEVLEEIIKPTLIGKDFNSIKEFDDFFIRLDGTPHKERLGGNLILGLSLAFSRALGAARGQELWEIVRQEFFSETKNAPLPRIFANLINGGQHAKNNLDIQEYMVVTNGIDVKTIFEKLKKFYADLGEFLKKEKSLAELPLGDEGGYVLDWSNNFPPLNLLSQKIYEAGLANDWNLAIDVAASGFYENDFYNFDGQKIRAVDLSNFYRDYFRQLSLLISIEDPFAEDDGVNFGKLLAAEKGKWIVGDDLTATDPAAIETAFKKKWINAVIIKANQIGTVSETCAAIKDVHEKKGLAIISHRSGETDDCFLIHLAKASGAGGVKIGAPVRERLLKYNELVRLYS
ncbi:MAG: hypothetical protein Q8L36_01515 [bacterium]|nr:hypothetical protein [bacterium]